MEKSAFMKKQKGFVIILSLFIVVTLSLIGIYFVVISRMSSGSSSFYQQDILVTFSKESAINMGYSRLLSYLRTNGFFIPYSNDILFHGEDINLDGKLEEEEDVVIKNGLIDTIFHSNLKIYSFINPSAPLKEQTIGGIKVKPSYIVSKGNLSIAIFLKILDASSKFNIKNLSEQIIKNITDYIYIKEGYEFLSLAVKEAEKNEYGWFSKFKSNYPQLYNFLTVYSYIDNKVIAKSDYSDLYKKSIYSVLQLYPRSIEYESFSPININTVNYDVLYNLLNGLKGYYFKSNKPQGGEFPMIDSFHKKRQSSENAHIGNLEIVEINDTLARKLTEAILNLRKIKKVIKDFSEIENYLLGYNFDKTVVDLVMANFNSSFYTYKYNVPYFDEKTVDRLQLINPTTTILFFPTGTFEFHYDVFVIDNKTSHILYNFADYSIVKLYDIYKYTLSKDFKDIQVNRTEKTVNGYALDIYPYKELERNESSDFDAYLGSSVIKIYEDEKLKEGMSFYGDFIENNLQPKIARGDNILKVSFKNFPRKGKLYGDGLLEVGNLFPDGIYFDNFSSLTIPLKGNFPPPVKLELYDLFMSVYKSSLLAELYNLAQAYPAPVKIIQTCLSFYIKPNRFLGSYNKPRILFNIFSPITKDYYSYTYFFGFLYPVLHGATVKPKVFVGNNEVECKEVFFNFGDTGGLAQLFGARTDSKLTIFDGIWHNLAFCISNSDFRDIKKQIETLEKFDVEIFRTKDWLYGPLYYKKLLDILSVSAKYVKIYIDGEEVGENITFPGNFKNLISDFLNIWRAQSITIGSDLDNPVWNYPLDSSISHFVIWQRIFPEDEAKRIFSKDKYYNERFTITLKNNLASAVYFNLYSKDNVEITMNNFTNMSHLNSIMFVKNNYSINATEQLKIDFIPAGSIRNNFIMIDNIMLFYITPLFVVK